MRHILTIVFLAISFTVFGQDTTWNQTPTPMTAWGYKFKHLQVDSSSKFLKAVVFRDTIYSNKALGSTDSSTRVPNTKWVKQQIASISGGGGDYAAKLDSVRRRGATDTIEEFYGGIGARRVSFIDDKNLKLTDTSDMLEPYLDTLQAHNNRIIALSDSVEEVQARELYFGFGFDVYGIDSVQVDSSQIATLTALRDTAAAIRADMGGGGGGGDVYLANTQTFTGVNTFNETATAPGGSPVLLTNAKFTGTFTPAVSSDTLAGLYINSVLNGTAVKYSILARTYDAMINDITIGAGNNRSTLTTWNTAYGYEAMLNTNNQASTGSTALGYRTLKAQTSGYLNTAVGYLAGSTLTTGLQNTMVGGNSMGATGTGRSNNTTIGYNAGYQIAGSDNTMLGIDAGRVATNRNVMIGGQSGHTVATGSDNVFIGYGSGNFTGSDKFNIANKPSATVQNLLYGDFSTGQLVVNPGTGTSPSVAASAQLEVKSTTKGFLPPRMTATEAEAISSPAEGLMIYSTNGTGSTITSKGWWGYDGSAWVKLN